MKNNFLFYKSYLDMIEGLDDLVQLELLKGVLNYGIYGVEPEFSVFYLNNIFKAIKPNIDNSSSKYNKAVENGTKGGRPAKATTEKIQQCKAEGMTQKETAEKLNCTIRTVQSYWNGDDTKEHEETNEEIRKNLKVNSSKEYEKIRNNQEEEVEVEEEVEEEETEKALSTLSQDYTEEAEPPDKEKFNLKNLIDNYRDFTEKDLAYIKQHPFMVYTDDESSLSGQLQCYAVSNLIKIRPLAEKPEDEQGQ